MTSIFNTTETAFGKASRIMNFLNNLEDNEVVYIAIGKPTPWTSKYGLGVSDLNPPTPLKSQEVLPEPIIYVRAKAGPAVKKLACDSAEPFDNVATATAEVLVEQSFYDREYQYLNIDSLYKEDKTFRIPPQYVYITGTIKGVDYQTDTWRASALFTNLILEEGVPNKKAIYTPDEVKGGVLNQITFNTPVCREEAKTHTFEYLINL